MKRKIIIIGIISIGLLLLASIGFRRYTKSFSPEAVSEYQSNGFNIRLKYCSPAKKGRKIFGDVVPYGQVWRTGANEATEITFNQDVFFAGKPLKAGSYALFTIPQPKEWVFILNSELGQWGAFQHKPEDDVLRVTVPASQTDDEIENFTLNFNELEGIIYLQLRWENTMVNLPITK